MRSTIRPNVRIANDFGIEHLLIHDATVLRQTATRVPGGSFTKSWNPVKNIKCRFTVYSPRTMQQLQDQQVAFPTHYKVFTLPNEDIRKGDRISFQGETYEVVDNPLNPSFLDHHLEIEVELLTGEV